MGKKVAIIYSNVAGGHKSAADALSKAISEVDPTAEVTSFDILKKIDTFPFNSMEKSWELTTKYRIVEILIGVAFRVAQLNWFHSIYSTLVDWRISGKIKKVLDEIDPDVVVSTHLIVSNALQGVKRRGAKYKTVSVACDLVDFPRPLADLKTDLVFAPTDAAAMRFQRFGIAPEKVIYPRFPIDPKMQNITDRSEVLRDLLLDPAKTTILFTGGGLGTTSMLPALKKLSARKDIQIMVAAGKDEKFKNRLDKMFVGKSNVAILGFVSNFQDYINAADIVIAKPGPATIVEIEMFEKKAIFTRHVGIQETGNLYYLDRNPNFRNIGRNYHLLLPTLDELMEREYIPYTPRFGFKAAHKMAQEILALADQSTT